MESKIVLTQKKQKLRLFPIMAVVLMAIAVPIVASNFLAEERVEITVVGNPILTTTMPPTIDMSCGDLREYNWSITNTGSMPYNFTTIVQISNVTNNEVRISLINFNDNSNIVSDSGIVQDVDNIIVSTESGTISFQANLTCTPGNKTLSFGVLAGTFRYDI